MEELNTSSGSGSGSETTTTLNPEAAPYNPPTTKVLWTYSDKHVLLQTAQVTAFNPDCPSKTRRVRIVMDTGSQRSYITEYENNLPWLLLERGIMTLVPRKEESGFVSM